MAIDVDYVFLNAMTPHVHLSMLLLAPILQPGASDGGSAAPSHMDVVGAGRKSLDGIPAFFVDARSPRVVASLATPCPGRLSGQGELDEHVAPGFAIQRDDTSAKSQGDGPEKSMVALGDPPAGAPPILSERPGGQEHARGRREHAQERPSHEHFLPGAGNVLVLAVAPFMTRLKDLRRAGVGQSRPRRGA